MEEAGSPQSSRLSERFGALVGCGRGEAVSLGSLVESLEDRSHALLILFLVVPFLQPIPLPGLSTVFGLVIVLFGVQMALDRPPWLPARLRDRALSPHVVSRICQAGHTVFRRFERLIRPRGRFFHSHPWMRRLTGALVAAAAVELSLPLPVPVSNFLPALTIAVFALGTLEEDGLLVVLGYALLIVATAYIAAIFVVPWLGIRAFA